MIDTTGIDRSRSPILPILRRDGPARSAIIVGPNRIDITSEGLGADAIADRILGALTPGRWLDCGHEDAEILEERLKDAGEDLEAMEAELADATSRITDLEIALDRLSSRRADRDDSGIEGDVHPNGRSPRQ